MAGSINGGNTAFENVNDVQVGTGNSDPSNFFDPENLNDLTLGGENSPLSRPKINRDTLDRNISNMQDFEDSSGPLLDPKKEETFQDWKKHTKNLKIIVPKPVGDNQEVFKLSPGKTFSHYANGIRSVYTNNTGRLQTIKVTVPQYSEASTYDFRADWTKRQEAFFVEVSDIHGHVVAQAQSDNKGKLELRGDFHAEAVNHADRRKLDWIAGFYPMINCIINNQFAQEHASRDSALGFISRVAYDMNDILLGQRKAAENLGRTDGNYAAEAPKYNYMYDLRSEPAKLGHTKHMPERDCSTCLDKDQSTGTSKGDMTRAQRQRESMLAHQRYVTKATANEGLNIVSMATAHAPVDMKAVEEHFLPQNSKSQKAWVQQKAKDIESFLQTKKPDGISQADWNKDIKNHIDTFMRETPIAKMSRFEIDNAIADKMKAFLPPPTTPRPAPAFVGPVLPQSQSVSVSA